MSNLSKQLFKSIEINDIETVQSLIKKGADVNLQSNRGETPIIQAAQSGNLGIVSLLIEHGAEINPQNNSRETPIFWAAETGNLEIVRLLMKQGADINFPISIKNKFFKYIVEYFPVEIVHFSTDTLLDQDINTEKPKIICNTSEYSNYWDQCKFIRQQLIFEREKIKISLRDFLKNEDDIKSVQFINGKELYKNLTKVKNEIFLKWPDFLDRITSKITKVSSKAKLHKNLESKGNVTLALLNPYLNHADRVNLVKALCSAISHPFTQNEPTATPVSDGGSSHINTPQIPGSSVMKVVAPLCDSVNYFPCNSVDCSPKACIIISKL